MRNVCVLISGGEGSVICAQQVFVGSLCFLSPWASEHSSTEQSLTAAGSGSSEELMCFGFGHQICFCGTLQHYLLQM